MVNLYQFLISRLPYWITEDDYSHGRPGYIEMKRKRLPITTARGLNEVQTEEIEELRGCSFCIKNIIKTGSK